MRRSVVCFLVGALLLSAWPGCKKLKFRKGSQSSSESSDKGSAAGGDARRGGSGPALSAEEEKDRQLSMKLQPYIQLTNSHSSRVYQSRNRYASWIKDLEAGPTCKERHIYGLHTISTPDSQIKEVEKVQGQEPRLPDIEEGAGKYTDALKKLYPLIKKADRYYSQKDYKEDGCAQAKEFHPQLMEAWKEFEAGDKILGKAIEKYNTGLHYRLLERIGKEFGTKSERYYHKKVTLDARSLLLVLRFESQEKEPDHEKIAVEVKKFDALVQEMDENVKNGSETSSFRSSANSYVQAVKEMMRRMKDGKPFSRMEKQWMSSGSGWMVGGSFDKVTKQFNDLIDNSNRVRFR